MAAAAAAVSTTTNWAKLFFAASVVALVAVVAVAVAVYLAQPAPAPAAAPPPSVTAAFLASRLYVLSPNFLLSTPRALTADDWVLASSVAQIPGGVTAQLILTKTGSVVPAGTSFMRINAFAVALRPDGQMYITDIDGETSPGEVICSTQPDFSYPVGVGETVSGSIPFTLATAEDVDAGPYASGTVPLSPPNNVYMIALPALPAVAGVQ
jgi:hypothetical protein